MKESIQKKINEIIKLSKNHGNSTITGESVLVDKARDSLSKVVRDKADGEYFMMQLNAINSNSK